MQRDRSLKVLRTRVRKAWCLRHRGWIDECDFGRAKEDAPDGEKYRARQNVVYEHGYLVGKLGRENVFELVKGEIETPGDISGVVYTPMDSAGAWKMQLAKDMQVVGLNINMNDLI